MTKPPDKPMKTPEQIIADIIQAAGGYVNHPNDRGGPTKYGITLNILAAYTGMQHTAADVQALTKDTATRIYLTDYFIRPKIDQLPDHLQPFMLDCAVNHEPKTAIKLLQRLLASHYISPGAIDGLIGSKTLNAIRIFTERYGSRTLLTGLIDARILYFEKIVKHDETQRILLAGWINRTEKFRPRHA